MASRLFGRVRRLLFPAFGGLAYALSWWPWPRVGLDPGSTPMLPFGPLLAVLIVVPIVGGRRGLTDLLRSIVRWRVAPRGDAGAFLLPGAITLAAVARNALPGAHTPWGGARARRAHPPPPG